MALLCPIGEMLKRYDQNLINQLVVDPPNAPYAQSGLAASLATDQNLTAALDTASGWVQGELTAYGRYTGTFLQTLAAAADSPPQALLFDLVATLAMRNLGRRRPQLIPDQMKVEFARALAQVEALKLGDMTLNAS
jgi:hypothetical protein